MNKDTIKKIFISVIAIYTTLVVSFYFVAGDELRFKESANNIQMKEADSVTEEITDKIWIEQNFINPVDVINSIELVFTKFYKQINGKLIIELIHNGSVISESSYDFNDVPEQSRVYLNFEEGLEGYKGEKLTLKISAKGSKGANIAAMMNKNDNREGLSMTYNKAKTKGNICFAVKGYDRIIASEYYWLIVSAFGIILTLVLFSSYRKYIKGNNNYIIAALFAIDRYKFLISQLVSRDFKSKYKRSILGVLWSFLNPLLTMIVQFFVFSTLFRNDTQSYPLYLLSGVICFNFFKETTDMCLTSISGNANLINKVYIPKYIFPLARTISSTINLGLALIPLLLVTIILGIGLHVQTMLIFYFLACLIVFSLGVGMFLATLMVFFRDIQFLWSVLSQIWMYATPIFYPAEIIPEKYKIIVRINPLYHFIGNLRKCLINGVSPEPNAYIYCLIFALLSFFIGSYIFKKAQDRFTLYL